jgi:glutathione S-transferase
MASIENDPHAEQLQPPYLKLYSAPSPNGQKITTFLQLLGVEYQYRRIDLVKGEQKQPWYLKIHPKGAIPAISNVDAEGHRDVIFESAVILQYLGEKYDKGRKYYHDITSPYYWDQLKWLTFDVTTTCPKQGFAFLYLAILKTKLPQGWEKYEQETEMIYSVYETRLKENGGWLVGKGLNIADISALPYIRWSASAGFKLDKFPALADWIERIEAVEGVKEGLAVV